MKDSVIHGDSHDLSTMIPDNSIALVVTSPPYFAGKEYEAVMGEGHVPASLRGVPECSRDVFAECLAGPRAGGRVAVNVANLGRKPYRSLAGDIVTILQDDLGLPAPRRVVWDQGRRPQQLVRVGLVRVERRTRCCATAARGTGAM